MFRFISSKPRVVLDATAMEPGIEAPEEVSLQEVLCVLVHIQDLQPVWKANIACRGIKNANLEIVLPAMPGTVSLYHILI